MCGLVSVATAGVARLPVSGALHAGGGRIGACLQRHSQSVTGAIQDLPLSVEADWWRATLRCEWPAHGGGTYSQVFELAPPERQRAATGTAVVTAVGVPAGLAFARRRRRSATTDLGA